LAVVDRAVAEQMLHMLVLAVVVLVASRQDHYQLHRDQVTRLLLVLVVPHKPTQDH
jgi:hypothetical protein